MSITRLYTVSDLTTTHLVEATSPAQAMRHVATQMFTVIVASPKTVAVLMGDGVKIEDATKEAAS